MNHEIAKIRNLEVRTDIVYNKIKFINETIKTINKTNLIIILRKLINSIGILILTIKG